MQPLFNLRVSYIIFKTHKIIQESLMYYIIFLSKLLGIQNSLTINLDCLVNTFVLGPREVSEVLQISYLYFQTK